MNRVQEAALKAELLKPQYSALDVAGKVAAINTGVSAEKFRRVEYSDVISYLMVVNKWLPIKVSTENAAEELIDAVNHFKSFDLNKPLVRAKIEATLDALIAATPALLSAADKAAILSMADMTIAEALGLGTVYDYDITNAEASPW